MRKHIIGQALAITLVISMAPIADAKKNDRNCPELKFLPFVLYDECDEPAPPYAASGWMGEAGHVSRDPCWKEDPHAGATCLRLKFSGGKGTWAGIAWQNPEMNWGEEKGGYNLEKARKLTFWGKGENGGERIKIQVGGSDPDKPFADSGKKEKQFRMTKQWKQYKLSLSGMDASAIITGFLWAMEGDRKPQTVYLDDIQYE